MWRWLPLPLLILTDVLRIVYVWLVYVECFSLPLAPVPADFSSTLMWYTKQGLRVIAAAHKPLNANSRWKEVDDMSRADLEQKAEFLGLIVMQNLVKQVRDESIKKGVHMFIQKI